MAKSGWCLGESAAHHRCFSGPWSNSQSCDCVCHSGSDAGELLIEKSKAREAARLLREQERERLWNELSGNESDNDEGDSELVA